MKQLTCNDAKANTNAVGHVLCMFEHTMGNEKYKNRDLLHCLYNGVFEYGQIYHM